MNDQVLFEAVRQGDEKAYKELFLKYYSPLCEYASQYVQDVDSEELVQDLMLYIWEEREVIVIETSLKSYLFTATKNRCLNVIKKNKYREQVHAELYETLKDQFEDPDYYLYSELSDSINKAVRELPERYRKTFELSRFYDMSYAQISKKQNISEKTVEYRISQSLKILRVKLTDYLLLLIFLSP
jgi:RNA polymerase sigma-70 factor (ECF subfamily)